MNKICEKCDTRCRLGMCNGRDGDFKYCFRKTGSICDLQETITPFNTLHELYEKCKWLDWINPETLILDNRPYSSGNKMVLLWGQCKGTNQAFPCGYVTAIVTEDMKQIEYANEVCDPLSFVKEDRYGTQ